MPDGPSYAGFFGLRLAPGGDPGNEDMEGLTVEKGGYGSPKRHMYKERTHVMQRGRARKIQENTLVLSQGNSCSYFD